LFVIVLVNSEKYKLASVFLLELKLYTLNYSLFVFHSCRKASLVEMEGVGEPRREKGPLDLFLILLFNSSNLNAKEKPQLKVVTFLLVEMEGVEPSSNNFSI